MESNGIESNGMEFGFGYFLFHPKVFIFSEVGKSVAMLLRANCGFSLIVEMDLDL